MVINKINKKDILTIKKIELTELQKQRLEEIIYYYLKNIEDLIINVHDDIVSISEFSDTRNTKFLTFHWLEFCLNILPKIMMKNESNDKILIYTALLASSLVSNERNLIDILYHHYEKEVFELKIESNYNKKDINNPIL